RFADQCFRRREVTFRPQMAVAASKLVGNVAGAQVDGRRDNVTGRLAAELDDVFAEVGLDDIECRRLEPRAQPNLLGDHRLTFGDNARARLAAYRQYDVAGVRAAHRPMHACAGVCRVGLERLEVELEVCERMVADIAPDTAQRFEFRERRLDLRATGDEAGRNVGERRLQRRIGERGSDARLKRGRPLHDTPRAAAWAIGGSPISPASTSATCRQVTGEPCRDSLPAMFIKQPSSPDSTSSGATPSMLAV